MPLVRREFPVALSNRQEVHPFPALTGAIPQVDLKGAVQNGVHRVVNVNQELVIARPVFGGEAAVGKIQAKFPVRNLER